MNFLAHSLIAERAALAAPELRRALVAGGLLGDFVKGPVPGALPADLALGVRLHRRVDAYSGEHPRLRQSWTRLPPALRRLAPVLSDLLADHYLARHWSRYHPDPLSRFARQAYADMDSARPHLPPHGEALLDLMQQRDLFSVYADWQGIRRAMGAVTRRLRRSELDGHLDGVEAVLAPLDEDFAASLPDLLSHGDAWLLARLAGASPVSAER